jgi:hypothetical protein
MNTPLHALAHALGEGNIDLGDERAAMMCLRRTHREGDVIALLDDAICYAREMMAALARPGDEAGQSTRVVPGEIAFGLH